MVAAVLPVKNGVEVCSALTLEAIVAATASSSARKPLSEPPVAGQREQPAELAAGGGRERLGPVDRRAFDERFGRVAEG